MSHLLTDDEFAEYQRLKAAAAPVVTQDIATEPAVETPVPTPEPMAVPEAPMETAPSA